MCDAEEPDGPAHRNYDKRLLKSRQPNTRLSGYALLNGIVAEGSRIVVTLNGTVTAEYEDDSFPHGPFALQHNQGVIRFRNVQLRPR